MKKLLLLMYSSAIMASAFSQQAENIILITTDGLRWQEVFTGMDSVIASNKKFNRGDSTYLFESYWHSDENERRKKLMPFLWNIMARQGQIYGNRKFDNKVDNANPFWFSYPGYNEIFTGYADTTINSNDFPPNPNVTVLEFLNRQPKYKNSVAAFGAWEAFDRILNETRSGIPVFSAFDSVGGNKPTSNEKLIHALLQDSYKPFGAAECLDVFTHYAAMEYLKTRKPKILYIAYGETDEWAHHGDYRSYLEATRQVDAWIKQIWEFVQGDPRYKNKTALFITTDHGRGDRTKAEWTDHGKEVADASQIWFAVMGPGVAAKGEMKIPLQVYQNQFAQTISKILGYIYKAGHPVAEEVKQVFNK